MFDSRWNWTRRATRVSRILDWHSAEKGDWAVVRVRLGVWFLRKDNGKRSLPCLGKVGRREAGVEKREKKGQKVWRGELQEGIRY